MPGRVEWNRMIIMLMVVGCGWLAACGSDAHTAALKQQADALTKETAALTERVARLEVENLMRMGEGVALALGNAEISPACLKVPACRKSLVDSGEAEYAHGVQVLKDLRSRLPELTGVQAVGEERTAKTLEDRIESIYSLYKSRIH
jgi:hypothetical protein